MVVALADTGLIGGRGLTGGGDAGLCSCHGCCCCDGWRIVQSILDSPLLELAVSGSSSPSLCCWFTPSR